MKQKKLPMYVVNACLASVVMYYVLRLSASGRTAIDWTVIGLVTTAILFNLVQLGRRLHSFGGARAVWHLQRTSLYWVAGLLNTAYIRPEHAGGWRTWIGWLFLVVAILDTIALFVKERQSVAEMSPSTPAQ